MSRSFFRSRDSHHVGFSQRVVLVLLTLVFCGTMVAGENFLGIQSGGDFRIVDPELERNTMLSSTIRLRFPGGLLFRTSSMGGAVMVNGQAYLAARESKNVDSSDFNLGWGLYKLDIATLTVTKVASLSRAMSVMTVAPNNKVYGVTFRPAQFVEIDLASGAVTDMGAFSVDQTGTSDFSLHNASLIWDQDSSSYLYAHNNHGGGFGLWSVAADGSSYATIENEVFSSFQPSSFLMIAGELHMMYYSSVYALDMDADPIRAIYKQGLSRSSYFGTNYASPTAYLPTLGRLPCEPGIDTLCLGDGYKVTMEWTDPNDGQVKTASNERLTEDSGALWFSEPTNLEVLVKVLDACVINNHRWFFAAASTNVAYTITVEELDTGLTQMYSNPAGTPAVSTTDTSAFPCS